MNVFIEFVYRNYMTQFFLWVWKTRNCFSTKKKCFCHHSMPLTQLFRLVLIVSWKHNDLQQRYCTWRVQIVTYDTNYDEVCGATTWRNFLSRIKTPARWKNINIVINILECQFLFFLIDIVIVCTAYNFMNYLARHA